MSYTKIGNLFNVITQRSQYFKSYWAGYRHNVNEAVVNNFNKDGTVGRLYPAVNWATPFGSSENVSEDSNLKEDIKLTLYFDNLQGRDNCGNQTGKTINEQIDELKEQARIFKETFKELCFDKYSIGTVNNSNINIDINSDAHNDSLLVVRLDINFTMFLDSCLDIDTTGYPDDLPDCDIENYCVCSEVIEPALPSDITVHLDASKGVNSGNNNDGESIFLWADQSGNNNDFGQSIGGFNPSWKLNAINSLPAINFDTSSYLERSSFVLSLNELSYFIVFKRNGNKHGGSFGDILMLSVDSYLSEGSKFFNLVDSFLGDTSIVTNTLSLRQGLIPVSNDTFLVGVVKTATEMKYYLNGVLVATNSGFQLIDSESHFIGGWQNNFFNGYVSEILIYDKALSDADTYIALNYLLVKYNL